MLHEPESIMLASATSRKSHPDFTNSVEAQALSVLPVPVLIIDADGRITYANAAAEDFMQTSATLLCREQLTRVVPFGSPVIGLVEEARRRHSSMSEHRIDIGSQRVGGDRVVDAFAAPLRETTDAIVLMLQERTIAEKMDRQLNHRGAARSISALGAMLAHEIKNPLSGIRGAAQLLEQSANEQDRLLTTLICDETDRIVNLVDRVEGFGDHGPIERGAVNIHAVLDHVKRLAQSGFGRHIRFVEHYDPSLPPVLGNRDQLVQVLLNLVKNAAEAIGSDAIDGEITLSTAYRSGIRMQVQGSDARVALPLEICVRDNGPGVPPEIAQNLFDPFITTKAQGTGLGLALVAKMIGDHGGIVECESHPRRTVLRILMPLHQVRDGRA
jgi:two-component system, NtrC family, nitrogen regulation sensor histidine kinase GlnL